MMICISTNMYGHALISNRLRTILQNTAREKAKEKDGKIIRKEWTCLDFKSRKGRPRPSSEIA